MIKIFENFLNESYLNPNRSFYGWIDSDNKFIKTVELYHVTPLRKKYPDIDSFEELYKKAYSDNWVRVHYRSYHHLNGELCLTADTEERIKEVLNNIFKDFLSLGRKSIIVVWGDECRFLVNDQSQVSNSYPKKTLIWDYLNKNNNLNENKKIV